MKKKQLSLLIVLVLLISTICIGCTDKKDDSTKTDATTISTTSEATTEDKTTEATSDECSVNIVKSNSWQNGDKFSAQFDGTINNKGSQTSDWCCYIWCMLCYLVRSEFMPVGEAGNRTRLACQIGDSECAD